MLAALRSFCPEVSGNYVRRISTVRTWNVFLAGEIHTDWRERITDGATKAGINVAFESPNLVHEDSDDAGVMIQDHLDTPSLDRALYDNVGAKLNAIRTRTLLNAADIVVARFDGNKYRQWNAAFDAGIAFALNKPIITLHPPELGHMLKEVNAGSLASCRTPEQVVEILTYVTAGTLPTRPNFIPFVNRESQNKPQS
mmetsp:Transcript_39120/g.74964  ORF Transcript_39120/g.74964 Transcript_39120/m.74964 type:complete len:198 (-) Transcript_39120:178-771(-)